MSTAKSNTKLLGREPAAWAGLVEAALTLLLALGIGVTQGTFGPIMAVVTAGIGVYVAFVTDKRELAAITHLVKAALILAVAYGAPLSDHVTAAIIGFVTVVGGFWLRTQVSPKEDITTG